MSWLSERVPILRAGRISAVIIGLLIGATIWAASPLVTGTVEPWDSDSPFYFSSLFLSGVVAWILFRKRFYFMIIGIYVGQLAYLLVVGLGPLFLVGLVMLVPYSLIAGLGALVAYALMGREPPKSEG